MGIDFSVRDHVIDPVAESVEVTLRMAVLRDTELVSRTLAHYRMVVVGSLNVFLDWLESIV